MREAAEKAVRWAVAPRAEALRRRSSWDGAARMRDRLIHHYFDIDLDILWATVTEDLPALIDSLPAAEDPGVSGA